MTDIVLVPGTTQTAAGFGPLVEALGQQGHRAVTVDVPSAAAATAAEYAALLATQMPADLDRPVVVAHSAAGLILPALALRLDARHQVWLAATVADYAGRRSFLAELQHDPLAVSNPEWLGIDPTSDPVLATYFLFHDADLAALRAALPTVARCDLSAVYAEIPTHNPTRVCSTYLLPTGDRTLSPVWMARVARERLHIEPTEVLDAGHNFYSAQPDHAAALIAAAAEAHIRHVNAPRAAQSLLPYSARMGCRCGVDHEPGGDPAPGQPEVNTTDQNHDRIRWRAGSSRNSCGCGRC